MRLAVQIGLPYLLGVFCTITAGWILAVAFALQWAPGVFLCAGGLVVLFVLLALVVVDAHWAWRIGWGVLVGAAGFAGGTLVFVAAPGPSWGIALASVPFPIVAALLSRNLWAVLSGALALVVGLFLIPAEGYALFARMWSGLHV